MHNAECRLHTPGPWKFILANNAVVAANGKRIIPPLTLTRHDGILIAAAPDLLDAAMAAIAYLDAIGGYGFIQGKTDLANQLHKAIKKATT
jgi:hypothetical protein